MIIPMVNYCLARARLLHHDETGASAVEYGLIVTLIALAIIVAAGFAGMALSGKFDEITTALQ